VLSFGKSFKQTLKMENLSDNEIKYTGALHTYFSVSHPKNVTVNTLNQIPFDCKLTGEKQIMDNKSNMQGPMDRIYYSAANVEILDVELNRKITISTKNTNQWVMWNPGKAVAVNMSDLHDKAQDEFFCLEAANTQWQVIPAHGCVAMSQSIDILMIKD
jgi:glucose-6-phosphate 1-epimerase